MLTAHFTLNTLVRGHALANAGRIALMRNDGCQFVELLPREAVRSGLVEAVLPSDELVTAGLARAQEMAAIPQNAFIAIRRNLQASTLAYAEATRIECASFIELRGSQSHREAVAAVALRLKIDREQREEPHIAQGESHSASQRDY